jgi:hypothetical protein
VYSWTKLIEQSAKWVETYTSAYDPKSKLFRRFEDDAAALAVSLFASCFVFSTMQNQGLVSAFVAAQDDVAGIEVFAHLLSIVYTSN